MFDNKTKKRLRIFAIALMAGTLMVDAAVGELIRLCPSSTHPNGANFVANPAGNTACMERLAQQQGKPCDLIFIGASNVEYWNTEGRAVWDKYYAPRHAFNFGVAGDRTENVLWRFDHMELKGLHPKAAVIFVGLNNFTDTPGQIAAGVRAVVKKTQATFPGVRILLVSLTPNGRSDEKMARANEILRTCADYQNIFYIDLYSRMPRQGDNWKDLMPDQLHFTSEGYEMWAEQMESTLQKIMPVSSVGSLVNADATHKGHVDTL